MAGIRFLLAVCCLLFPGVCVSALSRIHVHPDKHWFMDDTGRVRIFHGVNMIGKGYPWYPAQMLNQSRLDELQSWGFNAVRLGMMWAGTEPQEGRFNLTYISIIRNITIELGKRGIYVILDMHQDALVKPFTFYDGVPQWLVESFPPPEHPYPWPLEKITSWSLAYVTQACSHAFQCLYDNYKGAAEKMAGFWKFVASEFSNQTSVLGYELLNEPWVGDWTRDPELLLPGHAGKMNVAPLHDRVSLAIRTVDDEAMIFYEPVTWGYMFSQDGDFGSGFEHVPGGKAFQNRSVFSYHYYCSLYHEGQPYPEYKRVACDQIVGPKLFSAVQEDLAVLGGGSFLTEFGTCRTNTSQPDLPDTVECGFVLKEADSFLQSWTYWDTFKGNQVFWDISGRAIPERIGMFVRTYARAVAGIPTTMTFDVDTGHFQLSFEPDPAIKVPTEVFVPRIHYKKGYTVMASAELECEVDESDRSLLYVTIKQTNDVRPILTNTLFITVVPSSDSMNKTPESVCLKVNW
ncbi:endoglycoceramidase-like isoform X1 [Branchiostoma lanceolatum]|uniref:endoglycoceramidase-like isoform X1 n=2 Tax=Branchiostoma lanceolatum TaxID=7740 RepID=UPI0034521ECA